MAKPKWTALIFDLDGTLVDTINLIISSLQYTLKVELGQSIDPKKARLKIGLPLREIFEPYGKDNFPQLQRTYVSYNLEHLPTMQSSVAGISELIEELKAAGMRLGVATSKRRNSAQLSLDVAGLADKIPLVTTLEDTKTHKPNPEPILHALTEIHGSVEDAVYIGDAASDIQAAKAARVSQIAVTWGAGFKQDLIKENPTALVNTVAELRALLLI